MKKLFIFLFLIFYLFLSIVSFSQEENNEYFTIEVRGNIEKEKVMKVPIGTKFYDILDEIKILEDSDISQLSLNQYLYNNQIIVIPKKTNNLISINSATKEELIGLPGIGEKIADRIIEYRNQYSFKSIDEIKNVKGIGDKMYERIKEYICL